jgi:hypothetical protein
VVPMAPSSAASIVDDCIKERLDGASIDDVEGLVTDPITQEFIINPAFIAYSSLQIFFLLPRM